MAWSFFLFIMNINLSIDFTGGMQIRVANSLDESFAKDATNYLTEQGIEEVSIGTKAEELFTDIIIKTNAQEDAEITKISDTIQEFLIENNYIADEEWILQASITGPSVGAYMQSAALWAIIIGIILMMVYMLFSFASIRKIISPSILAAVTVVTMLFDILIPAGAYGLLMLINPTVQVDTIFIIAILTIMWYSINDTIVIFDRIRENTESIIAEKSKNILYAKIFEDSIWQTMRRSLGTSISTLLVVVTMYIFGTGVIKLFAFTTGIGVLAGSVSSIFIAVPLAYLLLGKFSKEQKKL